MTQIPTTHRHLPGPGETSCYLLLASNCKKEGGGGSRGGGCVSITHIWLVGWAIVGHVRRHCFPFCLAFITRSIVCILLQIIFHLKVPFLHYCLLWQNYVTYVISYVNYVAIMLSHPIHFLQRKCNADWGLGDVIRYVSLVD